MHLSRHLVVGATLALGSLLSAQGTYTAFGLGCPGTGSGIVCASANPNTTSHRNLSQNSNIFALGVAASTSLRIVQGFELFTQTRGRTTPLTIATQIYYADTTGKPTGTPKVTGTMTIGTTAGWYRTTFATPLIVPANQKLFLSYTSVAGQMFFPIASSGTKFSHFWHPASATGWNGNAPNGFITQFWAWKLICAGGPTTTLSNTGVPTINSSMTVDLSGGRANAIAIFAFGLSNTKWGSINLPFDLTIFNAAGCWIYVSTEFLFSVTTDSSGGHKFTLTVPNNAVLKGVQFYNQFVVDDPGANGFGATFSNGGAGRVG
jgi:hypothetical protein